MCNGHIVGCPSVSLSVDAIEAREAVHWDPHHVTDREQVLGSQR